MSESLISILKRASKEDDYSPEIKIAKLSSSSVITEKKRKYAILMMYSGWGYYGMQKSKEFPTIEGHLLSALNKAGLISEEDIATPSMIHFQRASRTDKNVSATGQMCVAKLPFSETIPIDSVNTYLPDDIRILDIFRVTKHFCPQKACNHRVYQYIMPTFAFAQRDTVTRDNCWSFRLSADLLTDINRVLLTYKGTKNYFNFTSSRAATDMSCNRFIMSVECGHPFLIDCDREFAIISVVGQSFMLHQIRKMIGLAIAVVSGYTTETIFEKAFLTERLDIPKAPGLGLVLNRVEYVSYNTKMCADGSHQAINWDNYTDKIENFKKKYILDHILKLEIEENSMLDWIGDMYRHSFDRRLEGSPSVCSSHLNEIPPVARTSVDDCDVEAASNPLHQSTSVNSFPCTLSEVANEPVCQSTQSFDDAVSLDRKLSSASSL